MTCLSEQASYHFLSLIVGVCLGVPILSRKELLQAVCRRSCTTGEQRTNRANPLHNVVERHVAFLRAGAGCGLLQWDQPERLIAELLLRQRIHPLAQKLLI